MNFEYLLKQINFYMNFVLKKDLHSVPTFHYFSLLLLFATVCTMRLKLLGISVPTFRSSSSFNKKRNENMLNTLNDTRAYKTGDYLCLVSNSNSTNE